MPDINSAEPLLIELPSPALNAAGGGINANNANASFGLARSIPRAWNKMSIIFQCASGNWVPQQTEVTLFEHGINDNFQGTPNPFSAAGISGLPAARSVEITNAMRNGGFSMTWQALLLAIGVMFERVRVVTPSSENTTSRVQRAGGVVGDNEFALTDRLLPTIMGASEFDLVPVNTATDCNLLLGIPQITTVGNGWEDSGIAELGQNIPGARWVFRDDIILDPGVSSNQDQPNRIKWNFRGLVTSIEKITDSISRADGTLLVVDLIMVADLAFGVFDPKTGAFKFASDFDMRKYMSYRSCV